MTTPLRGEVWDVALPRVGAHPCVVLTVDALAARVSETTVAMITGTGGPALTHVAVNADAGLTKYPVSFVNTTSIHTIPTARFRRQRGLLSPAELAAVEDAVRLVLGL